MSDEAPCVEQDVDQLVTCLAASIRLPIDPADRPDVIAHFRRLLAQAELVMQVALPIDMEPAPVFRA